MNSMRTAAAVAAEPAEEFAAENASRAVQWWLDLALSMAAVTIVAGWLALAALHVADDYRMNHTNGVWIAAAESAREGRLYPPLFDGEHYSGTRYMPLPILLNAAASAVVGDPLIGGKALAMLLMAVLLALVVMVLRRFSCPWPLAAALTAVILATETGLAAGTTVGGDLIPAVLQLAALAVALPGQGRRAMTIAGVLGGLAVTSKLTGMWGSLAVMTWLGMQGRWRFAITFATACVVTATIVLGAVQVLTGGGLTRHLLAFSTAGVHGAQSLLRAPNQLLYQLTGHAYGAVVLLPLGALGAIAWNWRRLSVVHIALAYVLLLLLVVYADVGTGFNQLLDLVVLTALAVGVLGGRAAASADAPVARVVLLMLSLSVLWAAGLDLVRTIGRDLRLSVADTRAGRPATPAGKLIAGLVGTGESVLSADPSIDIALGRRPVVMDAFMLARLDREHPEWVDPLIAKIQQRQFDLVVMSMRLEDPEVDFWWTDYHFGPRIAQALRAAYRPDGTAGRYYLYRPRSRSEGP